MGKRANLSCKARSMGLVVLYTPHSTMVASMFFFHYPNINPKPSLVISNYGVVVLAH